MTILFYTTKDRFGEFSNFSKHGVELDGKWWKTTEHYFQAQKFGDVAYQEKIRMAPDAKTAADLGRSREVPIKPDWDLIKEDVMRKAVLKKFQIHLVLKQLLLSI